MLNSFGIEFSVESAKYGLNLVILGHSTQYAVISSLLRAAHTGHMKTKPQCVSN